MSTSTSSRPTWSDPVGRLRWVGWAEGCSFLLLLGVAMPLKYLADLPVAVKYVGWAHGILFLAYCGVLLDAWLHRGWTWSKGLALFVAALVPFGPFIADRTLESPPS